MNTTKKVLFIAICMLLCCNEIVLNAQSTSDFLSQESFIGGTPFEYEVSSSSSLRRSSPPMYCGEDEWGPIYAQEGYDCDGNPLEGGGDTGDPGGHKLPIGDSHGFWIIAAVLYGLKCFYSRKKTNNGNLKNLKTVTT